VLKVAYWLATRCAKHDGRRKNEVVADSNLQISVKLMFNL